MLREDGKQLGYLERDMAGQLVADLSDFSAFIAGVGRPKPSRYLGVALLVVVNTDGADSDVLTSYATGVLYREGRRAAKVVRRRRPQGDKAFEMSSIVRPIVIGILIAASLLVMMLVVGVILSEP